MKILVTGGCGFLGSHVCEFYARSGNNVISYDNMTKYELERTGFASEVARDYNWNYLKGAGVKMVAADIRNFEDFKHIPILTKDIIKKNFKEMIAGNVIKTDLIANATGGSTGEPLSFYQDLNYKYWADAARIRGWYDIADCEYGDACAVIWGAMHEIKEDFSFIERACDLLKTGEIWLNAFNLSEKRKRKFFKLCKIIKPKLLRGYTTAIKDFAMYLEENRLTFPKIRGVIICEETVNDDMQKYVERVFDAPSYNTYGGRELSLIGMQCKYKNGLHEVSENNYVEYEPIKLSQYENAGNLIITNLNNYADTRTI